MRNARTSSGSSFSAREVNPTRSTNSTETTRRSSPAGEAAERGAPQALQNFAPSGFSCPQRGQVSTSGNTRVPQVFTTRPELRGTFGMVASTHWLASQTGMAVLERGGNACDAAVATGFVLQVVEPHANGPGGEVPIMLYSAERDEVLVVDGQGVAPVTATVEHYRGLGRELLPGTGVLAACVPGAFDAWLLLLRDFGTLSLADVLEPAIGYAEDGYPVVPGITDTIAKVEQVFRDEWPS